MTLRDGSDIPSVTIVNTNFTDLAGDHPFYGYDGSSGGADKYVSPTNCTSNPCTVSPFAGTCTAQTNTKDGVLCGTGCPTGKFGNAQEVTEVTESPRTHAQGPGITINVGALGTT